MDYVTDDMKQEFDESQRLEGETDEEIEAAMKKEAIKVVRNIFRNEDLNWDGYISRR